MNRGFSTIEIMIALAIALMVMGGVFSVSFGSQSAILNGQTNTEAVALAQALLEKQQADAKDDFTLVTGSSGSCQVGPNCTTNVTVTSSVDELTKTVTALVQWLGDHGQQLHVTLTTLVTDPQSAGSFCSQTLVGDWSDPQLLGTADVGQNNGGTDVKVLGKKAYVTANASAPDKSDFYVVNISDPYLTDLPILGDIDTGPGLASVEVFGHYAFVANESTITQLQVIDTTMASAPAVVSSLDVTGLSDAAIGSTVFYADNTVYLGITKSTGPEFYVIDVSDPLNPSVDASYEINSQVTSIIVSDGVAYLAVPDDISTVGIAEQLKVLDVSQASLGIISPISTFSPNPSTMSGEGLHLSFDGNTLYLGQGGANGGNKPQFFVLDISNPANLSIISSKYIPTSNDVTVRAIAAKSNLAFLWTSDTNLGFQVWDMNDLSGSTPYAALNTQQTATGGLDCVGNFIYTAQRSQKALQIIGPLKIKTNPVFSAALYDSATDLPVTTVIGGTNVYAKVTVSGGSNTPTGEVTFSISENNFNCGGQKTTEIISLLGGAAQSSDYTTDSGANPKDFSYEVLYGGDANYNSGASSCVQLSVE